MVQHLEVVGNRAIFNLRQQRLQESASLQCPRTEPSTTQISARSDIVSTASEAVQLSEAFVPDLLHNLQHVGCTSEQLNESPRLAQHHEQTSTNPTS